MRKFYIFFLLLTQFTLYGQSNWFRKDSLPSSGRSTHITFVIGNVAYAGLGALNWEQRIYSAEMFKYDPTDNSWEQLADFPGGARYGSSAFSLKGKGYICLGVDTDFNMKNDVWMFDPVTESWQKRSDFPGGYRYHASPFVLEEKAYLVSGSINQGNNYLNDLWCYDPDIDTWTQKTSLPTDHLAGPVTFSYIGKGYAVNGSSSTYEPVKDFYQYDPITNTWSQLPDFPGIRTAAVGFVIGDKVYVGSGTDFYLTYKSFWCYSFETNTWSSISDPPADFSQRIWGTAFTLGNTGYVLAGRSEPYDPNFNNGKMLNDLWAYAPCLPPVAKFSYIVNGLTVNFQDSSTTVQNWNWNFGDGCTSTLQNPVHSYSNPGKYQVCLTVEDSCGNGSFCDSVEVLCNKPTALWGYSNVGTIVHFFDSTTSASSWIWDFGDGYASYLQNPVHQYAEEGNYYVCLTAEDSCGSDIHCDTAQICDPLFTKFTNQNQGHFVIFSDSSEKAISWFWDFGDGFMSVLQNPVHYYQEFDTYYVCLTVTNICETKKCCDSILVMTNGIVEIPVGALSAFPNPVRDFLNIRWVGSNDKNTFITILNNKGEILIESCLTGLNTKDRIDVRGILPGLYFIKIINGDNIKIARFIKAE